MSATPARFRRRAAQAYHFRGVTKMIPQVITQRNPAAGLFQRTSSQGFLDYWNQRRSRVTEDSSATANSAAHDVFTQRSQCSRQGILDSSNRTDAGGTAEESSVVQKVRRRAAGRCCLPLSFIHFHE